MKAVTAASPPEQPQTKPETDPRSKPQACKVCGKILSSASSYYVHMKLHSGSKPFQCTACEASFCRKPYENTYQCDLCHTNGSTLENDLIHATSATSGSQLIAGVMLLRNL
ncbi:hypothetical protein L9F63_022983 [Diploptera punctata]|uniref:C2H2-type domain-containing protein n=1 Tax=Diploptera punctata TaxID=6984 RepID=A0AAD8EA97_DIPPU|nr:hypothetical protein L9F63_022983 [Diploptera punctata]